MPEALNNIAPLGMGTSSTPKKKKNDIANIKPDMLKTLEKICVLNVSKYVVKTDHSITANNITIVDSTNWYAFIKTKYIKSPIPKTP